MDIFRYCKGFRYRELHNFIAQFSNWWHQRNPIGFKSYRAPTVLIVWLLMKSSLVLK